jgi:hypothetical protein
LCKAGVAEVSVAADTTAVLASMARDVATTAKKAVLNP